MKKEYLECGKIVTAHGVRGEVKIYPWCDDPEMFDQLEYLYLDGKGLKKLEIEHARVHKNMVICKFAGLDNPDQCICLRNEVVYARREDIPMEEGEFFIQDLLGISVYDVDSGEKYGELVDVTETGANNVYHIQFANKEIKLIPAIPQVVIRIDIDGDRMEIRPLKGLFHDEEAIEDR
mgnify:CR=1 FL=1